ncbi:acid phosphatase [Sphingomonas montanisoli]|uniref:Acid phosphatase n=1 Tax=Sphingomonas montanisoli TaxID=2606412 RepID=A0A5D9C9L6_9SPHN|nr:phosphatase PAP2 family protein [Sphingomonas montanisoli]TZG27967.1 phosphatase PAP2 family protein [Sphingomonas montanisoli]
MNRWMIGGVAAALAAIPMMVVAQDEKPKGFLPSGYFDLIDVLPPAPIKEEPRGVADREIFKLTRALKGTPRWDMAVNDVAADTASMMRDFSCAAGIKLTPQTAPKTAALLDKASIDSNEAIEKIKIFYRRQRPFQIDQGEVCEPIANLGRSYDYPSGSATRSWTWGLILAEVLHKQASPILARARAFGESRVVCGSHNASAIEAGRMAAGSMLDVVRTERAYADAVVASRVELTALAKSAPITDGAACSNEALLVSQPVMR